MGRGEPPKDFVILLNDFVETLTVGQRLPITEGLENNLRLRLRRKDSENSWVLSVEEGSRRGEFHLSKGEGAFTLGQRDLSNLTPAMTEVLYEWMGIHAAHQARTIKVEDVNRAELSQWEHYLHEDYSKLELHATGPHGSPLQIRGKISDLSPLMGYIRGNPRWDLEVHPDISLMPRVWRHTHDGEARRSFDQWMERKTGLRLPDWEEVENGAPYPSFNHLGVGHSRNAILEKLLTPGSRFLEIGYGQNLGTLEAAEALGARVEGLELKRSYPPGRAEQDIRSGPVDVLHVNGSPFLYYHRHQATLIPSLDILRNFGRADWVVLQGYNARTPLEMLRHAELIHE